MFRLKSADRLSAKQADAALQNILATCNMPPTTVSFDRIRMKQKVNIRFYRTCISISIFLLLLTLLCPLPFLFIDSKVNSSQVARDGIYILNDYRENDVVYLKLSTSIIPDLCHITFPDGETMAPMAYDILSKTIAFPYTGEELSIYLETPDGISATVIITPNEKFRQ